MNRLPVVVILGPTAVGKTALSLRLAETFQGEIISGDSMQVYRSMDIGTAKASVEEREQVPHFGIDLVEPNESYSAAHFQEMASHAITQIHSRGHMPIIAGGTGFYIESLLYAFPFDHDQGETPARIKLQQRLAEEGAEKLFSELQVIDPAYAEKIHLNDHLRIIRALEIFETTGERVSERKEITSKIPVYDTFVIGLNMDRKKLYPRINRRVEMMFELGWEEEVRQLHLRYRERLDLPALRSLGYKEIAWYFHGLTTRAETIRLTQRNTRRFAKRQFSWFRHMQDIFWIDLDENGLQNEQWQMICDTIIKKFGRTPSE